MMINTAFLYLNLESQARSHNSPNDAQGTDLESLIDQYLKDDLTTCEFESRIRYAARVATQILDPQDDQPTAR